MGQSTPLEVADKVLYGRTVAYIYQLISVHGV